MKIVVSRSFADVKNLTFRGGHVHGFLKFGIAFSAKPSAEYYRGNNDSQNNYDLNDTDIQHELLLADFGKFDCE